MLLAEYGDFSMLLMGDLGTEGEAEIAEVWDEKKQVQILKAGHHGSSTSSSELFLDTVRPKLPFCPMERIIPTAIPIRR